MATLHQAGKQLHQFEQLAAKDSPIHRIHPMSKLLVTIVYLVAVVSVGWGDLVRLMLLCCYPLLMLSLSDTPLRPLMRTMLIALPFPLFAGLSNLWAYPAPIGSLGPILISEGGVLLLVLLLKSLLCVLAVGLLMATTSFVNVCAALAKLRVPRLICLQLLLLYRYLSLFLTQAGTMMTAYSLRNPNTRGIRLRQIGPFLGQLLLRSFDRSDRVYQAMCCRGFSLEQLSQYQSVPPFRRLDAWYFVAVTLSVLLLRFFVLP